MSRPLDGRYAVVTGAASGIGAACARQLANDGAAIAVVDRADCEPIVAQIRAAGGVAVGFRGDLADMAAVESLGASLLDWKQGPLILVNNAGIYPTTPLDTLDLPTWRRVFALNVDAPAFLSLALIPAMKTDGWGRIVNVASSIVALARRDMAAYTASKMAIIGLTRAFASDLGPHGVTVNAVAPGLTRTGGVEAHLEATGRTVAFTDFVSDQPIKRVVEPRDLAEVVAFLASDASAMMTAQTLVVDGGLARLRPRGIREDS